MPLSKDHFLDRTFMIAIGAIILLSFPANLARLASVGFFSSAYFDLVYLSFFALALLNVPFVLNAPLRASGFATAFVIYVAYIAFLGFALENASPLNGLKYYVLPVVAYFLMLGRDFWKYLYSSSWFWNIVLYSHAAGMVFYFLFLHGRVYPGIGVQSIALASIFFLAHRKYSLFLMAATLVILENKRSIMISLFLTLFLLRLGSARLSHRFIYMLLGVAGIASTGTLALLLLADVPDSAIVERFNLLNPFAETFDPILGSSGRAGEIISFFFNLSFAEILVGSGAGFTYEWDPGFASDQAGEIKGYFHMSLANYLAAGGLLGVFVVVWMAILPFRANRLDMSDAPKTTAFGLGIFVIIQSMFGFNLATDAISLMLIFGPAMLTRARQVPACHAPSGAAPTLQAGQPSG